MEKLGGDACGKYKQMLYWPLANGSECHTQFKEQTDIGNCYYARYWFLLLCFFFVMIKLTNQIMVVRQIKIMCTVIAIMNN